jgi:thiosulfate dehydrogenase
MKNINESAGSGSIKALAVLVAVVAMGVWSCKDTGTKGKEEFVVSKDSAVYVPPDTGTIPHDQFGDMVRYGRDLIVNTAHYIGPEGIVGKYTFNKMSCANCHADAGTRPFGFNFFSSHARYPQYRGRENMVLDMEQRINNCVERPGNGKPIPLGSKEIVAMECYMKWLSTNVPVGGRVKGDEMPEIDFPERAADIQKGAAIFVSECMVCHGKDGEGMWGIDSSKGLANLKVDSSRYLYPPLWGPFSYQNGSSPSRVIKLARFIKANMPSKKATWRKPYLTDEQCIDVAAFINDGRIHPRPQKKDKSVPDYPDTKMKAIDYEAGPYIDTFSALQHKFGPYKPIIEYHKKNGLPVIF